MPYIVFRPGMARIELGVKQVRAAPPFVRAACTALSARARHTRRRHAVRDEPQDAASSRRGRLPSSVDPPKRASRY